MQTKVILCAALFSVISLVIAEPIPQENPGAQATAAPTGAALQSKNANDLISYRSSVTAAAGFSSYNAIIRSAGYRDIINQDYSDITANPSFTALPSAVRSFIVSEKRGEAALISNNVGSSVPLASATSTSKPTGSAASSVASSVASSAASKASTNTGAASSAASSAASKATGTAAAAATSTTKASSTTGTAKASGTTSAAKFSGGVAPKPTGVGMAAGVAAGGLLGVLAML